MDKNFKHSILYIEGSASFGGSSISLINTLKHLDFRYHPIVLLLCDNGHIDKFKKSIQNLLVLHKKNSLLRCVHCKIINILLTRIIHFFQLLSIIKKYNISLVHSNNGIYYPAIIAAKFLNVPIVCHLRSLPIDYETGKQKLTTLTRLFGKLSKCNISISEAIKREYQNLGLKSNNITVIHDGINLDENKTTISLKKKGTGSIDRDSNLLVGTISRFSWEKGIDYLIDSIPLILSEIDNIRFELIGDGPLMKNLQLKVNTMNLNKKVFFTGWLDNPYQNLLNFDVFVLPSLKEGLSLSIMEAMSLGIPVVATKVGGVIELIEDSINGILVEPGDPKSIANGVISLLNNQCLRNEISKKACIKAKNKFSIRNTVAKIEGKYAELLHEQKN